MGSPMRSTRTRFSWLLQHGLDPLLGLFGIATHLAVPKTLPKFLVDELVLDHVMAQALTARTPRQVKRWQPGCSALAALPKPDEPVNQASK